MAEDSHGSAPSAVIYVMRVAAAAHPAQTEDTETAKNLLHHSLGIHQVRIVDLAAHFHKRQEVERATAGKKHFPIIYIDDKLIGVRSFSLGSPCDAGVFAAILFLVHANVISSFLTSF